MRKNFTEFLNEKFAEAEPSTLDDEWIDKFDAWLEEAELDDIIAWADEYANLFKKGQRHVNI